MLEIIIHFETVLTCLRKFLFYPSKIIFRIKDAEKDNS